MKETLLNRLDQIIRVVDKAKSALELYDAGKDSLPHEEKCMLALEMGQHVGELQKECGKLLTGFRDYIINQSSSKDDI